MTEIPLIKTCKECLRQEQCNVFQAVTHAIHHSTPQEQKQLDQIYRHLGEFCDYLELKPNCCSLRGKKP